MCELHESGSDWKEFARMNYQSTDPYAEYRKELGGKATTKKATTKKATTTKRVR
jgi:hypothetical protein